jgi:hypothetical protein
VWFWCGVVACDFVACLILTPVLLLKTDEIAMEKLGPMIAQFGALTVAPTDCHDGSKGVLLSFVSPNNAVQMMVPAEALSMDFSTLLQSFEVSLGLGFDFKDCLNLDGPALVEEFSKVVSFSVKGEINKGALKHAREVAAAMMGAEADPVKFIGLFANLARANVSLEFDSFADLIDVVGKDKIAAVVNIPGKMKENQAQMATAFGAKIPMMEAQLGMEAAQIKEMYADIQGCLGGVASVTAASTLGVRATLTFKNFNVFCMCKLWFVCCSCLLPPTNIWSSLYFNCLLFFYSLSHPLPQIHLGKKWMRSENHCPALMNKLQQPQQKRKK